MTNVLLTGSEGVVGRVLTGRSLGEGTPPQLNANMTRLDVQPDQGGTDSPFIQSDLQDPAQLTELLIANDVFIHAAWNTEEGILYPEAHDPQNVETAQRILNCAAALGESAAKVVIFSSVNAHVPENWQTRREARRFISVDETPRPNRHNRGGQPGGGTTRYGESKLAVEDAALQAAAAGLHVVVVRLGGVNLHDKTPSTNAPHQAVYQDRKLGKYFDAAPAGWEDAVHVHNADLVSNVQQVVDAPKQPGTFQLYNLVSDNTGRIHQI